MSRTDDEPAASEPAADTEAERAAETLKGQIAAVRRRVRDAQDTLREHAQRAREDKSFKR